MDIPNSGSWINHLYIETSNNSPSYMTFDIEFLIGILIYIVLFVIWYIYTKRTGKKQAKINDGKNNTLRYILGALFLALCWLIIAPLWFPELYNNQLDFYRILITVTTIIAIVTAYKSYIMK